MAQIFTALLLTSGIGTALALILTLLKPITRKVFSGGWHYYMWLVVLLVMILPIRLNLPEKPVTTPPISETVTITDNQIEITDNDIKTFKKTCTISDAGFFYLFNSLSLSVSSIRFLKSIGSL